MRVAVALAGLAVLIALAPGAQAQEDLRLVPDWPDSMDEARSQPIRLLPGPPMRAEASHAPAAPGSSTAGTAHAFHLTLENPDGSKGPAGAIALDPARPIVLDVYLSAGPSDDDVPEDTATHPGPGLAPRLTVEATLAIANETIGPANATATLVSAPTEDTVTRYRLTFEPDTARLDAGAGLDVDLSIYQAESAGERVTQPQWRIHTGNQHPTGLSLPLDPVQPWQDEGVSLSLQGTDEVDRDSVRTGAYGALVAAVAAAGWATRRGYRELRED